MIPTQIWIIDANKPIIGPADLLSINRLHKTINSNRITIQISFCDFILLRVLFVVFNQLGYHLFHCAIDDIIGNGIDRSVLV